MPYCPNCGKQLNERVNFCPDCGAKIELEENLFAKYQYESIEPTQKVEEKDPYLYDFVRPAPIEKNETKIAHIKDALKSPVNLVLGLLLTVFLLLGVFTVFSDFNFFNFLGSLTGLISLVFITSGVWLAWYNSRKEEGNPSKGFRLIKAGVIIDFVVSLIFVSLIAVVLFIFGLSGELLEDTVGEGTNEIIGIIMGAIIVVLAIAYASIIILFTSILKFVNSIKEGLEKGENINPRGAILVAVLLFLCGLSTFSNALQGGIVFDFEAMLGSTDVEPVLPDINPLSIIQGVFEAITMIYAGVAILIYRSNIVNKQ